MDELVPSEFFLSQNYPNPFKEVTNIKYCLPVKTKAHLTVSNSNGNKVKELLNDIQEAGTYEIKFDGCDAPEGYYYYTLKAVNPELSSREIFIETKKMVLIK
jgi:hypothetical protein